jgi:steroid 5-alpha reductase family enzyme
MSSLLLSIVAVGITAVLSAIMAAAWSVQQKTGNSGWVDVSWTFGTGASHARSRCCRLSMNRGRTVGS